MKFKSLVLTGVLLQPLTALDVKAKSNIANEPTNAAEAAAQEKAERNRIIDERYRAWKSTLSKEHQQWEDVLEANLGSFYFPLHQQDKSKGVPMRGIM